MQSYSIDTINDLPLAKIEEINDLYGERFDKARERLLEKGTRFFMEERSPGVVYYYMEEELPVPADVTPFEEVPFSEFRERLETEVYCDSAEELFCKWRAEEMSGKVLVPSSDAPPASDDLPY